MTESSSSAPRPGCDFCRRSGLPILPVRYAVARTDAIDPHPPELSGDFGDESLSRRALPDGQTYTLRLMREGYLYVFNEAAGRWTGYVITDQGYLSQYVDIGHDELLAFDPNQPGPIDRELSPPANAVAFRCNDNPDHVYPGRCVTVVDADHADRLYLAYSETAWNKRVWKEHATNEHQRRDQMRPISLSQWKGGRADHVGNMNDLARHVAEASWPWSPHQNIEHGDDGLTPFSFSLYPLNGMEERCEGLVNWANTQAEEVGMAPMMVALDDPVGMASDLAALMHERLQEFISDPVRRWPLATATLLNDLEESIKEDARNKYIDDALKNAHVRYSLVRDDRVISERSGLYGQAENAHLEEGDYYHEASFKQRAIDEITPEMLEGVAADAWEDYNEMLRKVPHTPQEGESEDKVQEMSARDIWEENSYRPELDAFEAAVMMPLSLCHSSWLTSSILVSCLDANHDDQDPESGAGFADSVLNCIGDTQQYRTAHELYTDWLAAREISRENLLLRGLVLDIKAIKDVVNDSLRNIDIDPDDVVNLPWSGAIAGYQKVMENHPEYKGAPGRLLGSVVSPYVKTLVKDPNSRFRPAFLILGIIAERPIVKVEVRQPTLKALVTAIRTSMAEVNPRLGKVDAEVFERRLEIATRREGRHMTPAGAGTWDYPVAYDRYMMAGMDDAVDDRGRIKVATSSIMNYPDYQQMSPADVNGTTWAALGSRNIQLGVVSAIIGLASFWTQLNALFDSTEDQNKVLVAAKLGAISFGVVSAVADTIKAAMERRALYQNRLKEWADSAEARRLAKTGKIFGLGSAILFSGLDFLSAYNEGQDGSYKLTALYILSGVSGAVSFALLSFESSWVLYGLSAPGWGWVIAGIAVGVNIVIWLVVKDDLQNWIRRSYFGKNKDLEGFEGLAEQMKDFDKIFAEQGHGS